MELLALDNEDHAILPKGEVPILEEIYLAVRDFNAKDNEPPI